MTQLPDSERFVFWTPPEGFSIPTGPEATPCVLPRIPLPLHKTFADAAQPSPTAIGESLYDYLRQYPDCAHNSSYAELLRDGFPHYIADLGAQAAMLEHKDVSGAYVERMIAQLKILALLEPHNPGLLLQLGKACFDLAMTFEQLPECRLNILKALGYFNALQQQAPDQPICLSYLGQINFLLGDYPKSCLHLRQLLDSPAPEAAREAVAARLEQLNSGDVPPYPLLDDLEQVGESLLLCGSGEFRAARELLEELDEKGWLSREFDFAEFPYLLGLCRHRTGELAGARSAYLRSLATDPNFVPARNELASISTGVA